MNSIVERKHLNCNDGCVTLYAIGGVFTWKNQRLGGIPFSVTLPKALESVNADLMSQDELRRKLQKGLYDAENGNVRLAAKAFDEFRENHFFQSFFSTDRQYGHLRCP